MRDLIQECHAPPLLLSGLHLLLLQFFHFLLQRLKRIYLLRNTPGLLELRDEQFMFVLIYFALNNTVYVVIKP